MGEFCAEQGCPDETGFDAVLRQNLGVDLATFHAAWQGHWASRLGRAQADLDTLLARRTEATLSGDTAAFLTTIDTAIPHLAAESEHWLAAFSAPPQSLEFSAKPIGLLPDGKLLAQVALDSLLASGQSNSYSFEGLFTPSATGLLWVGPRLEAWPGEPVSVRYPPGQEAMAAAVGEMAAAIYPNLAAIIEVENPPPLVVALYDDRDAMRVSIGLNFTLVSWAPAWTAPQEGIKLLLTGSQDPADYKAALVRAFARRLLLERGIESEWLLKGLSAHLVRSLDEGVAQQTAAAGLPALMERVAEGAPYTLAAMPPDHKLPQESFSLAQAQAWDSLRFLMARSSAEQLDQLLDRLAQGESLDQAMETAIELTAAEFQDTWTTSLLVGHTQEDWLAVAGQFDEAAAASHVDYLTRPELSGREAGTNGERLAAKYIAERFAEYGLEPGGNSEGTTYLQTFAITPTLLTELPRLVFSNTEVTTSTSLVFREDFTVFHAGAEQITAGELVWVEEGGDLPEELAGSLVIRQPGASVEDDLEWAREQGAGGLILVTFKREPEEIYAKATLSPDFNAPIPVFELTRSGFFKLQELLMPGEKPSLTLPAGPLGIQARLTLSPLPRRWTHSANVLGFLQGSDPLLSQEVIVIGAHYDHVGDDPTATACLGEECVTLGGLRYSGANDNASGMGVLLEIARLWAETGYRPQRSVLFAAWGAQELGQLGSRHFLEHPTVPRYEIVGLVQLDGVGGGEGFKMGAQGDPAMDGLLIQRLQAVVNLFEKTILFTEERAISDHTAFEAAGLPALLIQWRLASEANLPDGIGNAVHQDRLGESGRMVTLLLMALGG